MINQLGNFYFAALHGPGDRGTPPVLLAEQVETLQRPGVDGTAIIKLGQKADPFQLRSVVDTTTFEAAMYLAAEYMTYQGNGPYGLIWGNINFLAAFNVVYVPSKVEIVKVRRLSCAAGGLSPPSLGLVEALWTLQPVALPDD